MKNILSIITVLAIVFAVSSCGNKKKKADEHVGTHTHEDGTVHRDDAHDQDVKPNQETFEVKADGDAELKHEGGDHDHDGHEHEHGDEAGHEHEHGEHK